MLERWNEAQAYVWSGLSHARRPARIMSSRMEKQHLSFFFHGEKMKYCPLECGVRRERERGRTSWCWMTSRVPRLRPVRPANIGKSWQYDGCWRYRCLKRLSLIKPCIGKGNRKQTAKRENVLHGNGGGGGGGGVLRTQTKPWLLLMATANFLLIFDSTRRYRFIFFFLQMLEGGKETKEFSVWIAVVEDSESFPTCCWRSCRLSFFFAHLSLVDLLSFLLRFAVWRFRVDDTTSFLRTNWRQRLVSQPFGAVGTANRLQWCHFSRCRLFTFVASFLFKKFYPATKISWRNRTRNAPVLFLKLLFIFQKY